MRALLAVLLGVLMGAGSVDAAELTSQQLAAKAQDSLVFIATKYFDENTSQTKAAGSGTGFVITASGLVLTAYHVVKDWNAQSDEDKTNNPLRVRLGSSHGDEVDAQIVGVNEQYDVALLQILRPGTYKATGVCFATTLNDGEAVTGFGFPDGLERQSSPGTFGNASADNGRWAVSFNNAEGMSGGPLYDAFGDVVGIIRGTYGGQGASNVVTPVRRARSMIEDQTSFKEECLRDAPPAPVAPVEPPSTPVADGDWYGGSLWKDDDYCGDVQQAIKATTNLKSLHRADTGAPIVAPKGLFTPLKENLLLTEQSTNEPQCALDAPNFMHSYDDIYAYDCTLDISQSSKVFDRVFSAAASDLVQCLGDLGWAIASSETNCTSDKTSDVDCTVNWQNGGQEARLYGFSSGTPTVYGLGVFFSVPKKK
jgi:hypothetical protein